MGTAGAPLQEQIRAPAAAAPGRRAGGEHLADGFESGPLRQQPGKWPPDVGVEHQDEVEITLVDVSQPSRLWANRATNRSGKLIDHVQVLPAPSRTAAQTSLARLGHVWGTEPYPTLPPGSRAALSTGLL